MKRFGRIRNIICLQYGVLYLLNVNCANALRKVTVFYVAGKDMSRKKCRQVSWDQINN